MWLNFLFQLYNVYLSKQTKGTGYVISAGIAVFFVSSCWIVLYLKFRRYTRYLFIAFYVVNVFMEIMISSSGENSAFYAVRGLEVGWVSHTIGYLIIATAASYCEFNICAYFYTPLYLLGTYLIS